MSQRERWEQVFAECGIPVRITSDEGDAPGLIEAEIVTYYSTVPDFQGVTFAMLERVSQRFGTKQINLGNSFGYYGSHNDTIEVLNATREVDE